MIRSAVAVIAGYLVFALSAALLFGLSGRDPKVLPSVGFAVFSVGYGAAFAVLAGFITAAVAKRHEVRHAALLAAVLAVIATVSLLAQLGEESIWSEVATIVFIAPGAAVGGYLRQRQSARRAATPEASA